MLLEGSFILSFKITILALMTDTFIIGKNVVLNLSFVASFKLTMIKQMPYPGLDIHQEGGKHRPRKYRNLTGNVGQKSRSF